MANESDVKSLVDNTVKIYGRLDYAFNNAGVEEIMTPFLDQTPEKFDHIMNTRCMVVYEI